MTRHLILTLTLSLFAGGAFAVPSDAPFPLIGESRDSQAQQPQLVEPLAENGAERTSGGQRIQLAEGGAERLLDARAPRA